LSSQWDRLPFLTKVLNGTATIDSAYNHLNGNMMFSGSPYAIDTDDGSDLLNCRWVSKRLSKYLQPYTH
jgi:hypothetical protein